jgi:hypothetical protein
MSVLMKLHVNTVSRVDDREWLRTLRDGRRHRFSSFHEVDELPRTGAGVYTIWREVGTLVYVGIAGRNISGKGLHGRLKSHYQGRRSGDQFCVYVADRQVLPSLNANQRRAIGDGELSLDRLVRDYVRAHLSFRYVQVDDYATAIRLEHAIKAGGLGDLPLLNSRRSSA